MSSSTLQQKVVAYICRFHQGLWQLLVFEPSSALSGSGAQIPSGWVEEGDDLKVVLEKRILEESGLENLMVLSQIDQYDAPEISSGKTVRRHVFLALAPNENREQWTHYAKGSDKDQTVAYHFQWIPIAQARSLPADFGRSVKNCIQLLFERKESH